MKFSTHLFIGLLAVVISPPSLPVASAEVGGISGSSSVTLNGTSGADTLQGGGGDDQHDEL